MNPRIVRLTSLLFFVVAGEYLSAEKQPLLNVRQGQLPNDTAFEKRTTFSIEGNDLLSRKVLKVVCAKGDSFGMNRAGMRNWNGFSAIEFQAVNPAAVDVKLIFTVKHAKSSNFRKRVDSAVRLRPGKNSIRINLAELKNNDGSAPELSAIQQWYFHSPQAATLYFDNLWLTGPNSPPEEHSPRRVVKTDPKRLKRIRSAKMPKLTQPTLFFTKRADDVLAALEVFPPDNPWNEIIEDWPLHPNSKKLVASVGADKPFRYNPDMGFVLLPPDQPKIDVKITSYRAESDPGPYPVPDITPIEGWPGHGVKVSREKLDAAQRDVKQVGGDRHAILVDPVNRMLYEFYQMKKTDSGWQASQASIFDLKSNELRPEGWTSADAAGLPIFPAVVRYDELQRGEIEHAMRVTIRRTRRAYVHPATHYASRLTDANLPRMGERFRLRKDFDISGFSPAAETILRGLKKYGMLVADNGIEWAISVTPDPRIPILHEELRRIKGSDFEVVVRP